MKKYNRIKKAIISSLAVMLLVAITNSCEKVDNTLAPYVGSPKMSDLLIENKSFAPKVTWIGGYVTAFGINKGSIAALDNTLIWLISKPGNGITYPVKYGELQQGAQDLTAQYGGTFLPELIEDSTYTFWVMKEDVWSVVSSNAGKPFVLDSTLSEGYQVIDDTIKLSSSIHIQRTQELDNYINIFEISTFGQLGTIQILQTNTSDHVQLNWTIHQAGVIDTMIAAIGIADGNQYTAASSIWEAYSEVDEGGQILYGKHNVISGPLISGEALDNTKIFVDYPVQGLERNKTYYVWIANKDWNGVGRLRATPYYAYATFRTR